MRVTLVTPYPVHAAAREAEAAARFGGVEVAVLSMAEGLAARGADVTLLSSGARDEEVLERRVKHRTVKRRGMLFGTPLCPGLADLPRSDVVHVMATYPGVSDRVVRAGRRAGVPVVLDYHFDGHAPGVFGAAAARAYYALNASTLLSADLVLAKTASYARASRVLSRLDPDRLRVVPNGVDPAAFPLSTGPRAGVLCVGRLVPYKGVATLVRAAALGGFPVTVAGDGPERARLEALARELGAPVRFLGYVPEERLPALYGAAAVTALPSANAQEAFGICLVESMATGTPVVASDLPGVREVATLGGRLARPNDPASLAKAIRQVLDGPRLDPAALRRVALERYSWDRVVDRLIVAYDEAVGVAA